MMLINNSHTHTTTLIAKYMDKLLLGGDFMDENIIDGSYTRYRMPSEKDLANSNIQREVSNKNSTKSSIPESFIIQNNTVR